MVEITLGFGKYRGKTLGEVPYGYLQWILRKFSSSTKLAQDARREIDRRPLSEKHVNRGHGGDWDSLMDDGLSFGMTQDMGFWGGI